MSGPALAVAPDEEPGGAARSYAGVPAHERTAARRARLLAAGRTLFATRGIAATTVKGTCAAAGLSSRYFYESFASVEELAMAVVEELAVETSAAVLQASEGIEDSHERTLAAVRALVTFIGEHPDAGRIMLVETAGNGAALSGWRRGLMAYGADVLDDWLGERGTPTLLDGAGAPDHRRIAATMMAGGVIHALIAWLDGDLPVPTEQLADALVQTIAPGRGPLAAEGGRSAPQTLTVQVELPVAGPATVTSIRLR